MDKNKHILKEFLRRKIGTNTSILTFPKQQAFVADKNRYVLAQCSRRAGKTNGIALRFIDTMAKNPGATCRYLALTRESAKSIMWPILHEMDDRLNLGYSFTESNLTMRHPNGAKLQLYGADMSNFIKRLRGTKSPGVAIDEAQDFGQHLQSLINDVLAPTLVDYPDSWLALTGTPGPVPTGYFYDACHGKYGYSIHNWTILDNPYVENAEDFIYEFSQNNAWEPNNPTLLREWRNQWVMDKEALWVRYDAFKSDFTILPPGKWTYVVGIDLGFKDNDAIAVLSWSEDSNEVYLVEEWLAGKQGITELVEKINQFSSKYPVSKMVIDEGGLGKKIAEEIRRRHAIPVQQADKHRKQENVEFLNDWLRLGRFKAKKDSTFALDSYKVQIDWEKSRHDKIVIKKHPHSDIIDAVLYAFRECYAFAYQKPKELPKMWSKEYWEKEVESMFEKELEKAQTDSSLTATDKALADYKNWKL